MDRPRLVAASELVPLLNAQRGLAFSFSGGSMKEIPLSRHKVALVDDEDFEKLNEHKWLVVNSRGYCYAIRHSTTKRKDRTSIQMSRVIMKTPKELQVDHINHNTLDNQKANLRNCSAKENSRNRIMKNPSLSGFKGVDYRTIKRGLKTYKYIVARIGYNGKIINLGYFSNLESAARSYDAKAKELFGNFANLNFPMEE
jgi:hypothetical protein